MIGTHTNRIKSFARDILRRFGCGATRTRVVSVFFAALALTAGATPARAACEVTAQEFVIGSSPTTPWTIDPLAPIPARTVTLHLTIAANARDCLVMARLADDVENFTPLIPFEWNSLIVTPRITTPGTSVFGDPTCGAINARAGAAARTVTFIWTLRAALKPNLPGAYSVPAPTSGDSGVGKVLRARFKTLEQPAIVTSCSPGGGTGYGGAQGGDEHDAFDWLWLKVPHVLKFELFSCARNPSPDFARFPTIANAQRAFLCMLVQGNVAANLAFSSASGSKIVNIDNSAAYATYRGEIGYGALPRGQVLAPDSGGVSRIFFDPIANGMSQRGDVHFTLLETDTAFLAGNYLDKLTVSVEPSSAAAAYPGRY